MSTQVDIKLLWGRAASRCAICRRELTQDKRSVSTAFVLGEQAHIVGEDEGSPRGKSALPIEERDAYHNRILLCPTHHKEVDKAVEDYPVERLHMLKTNHELWVQDRLTVAADSRTLANEIIYSHLVDSAVELCQLPNLSSWANWALAAEPSWDKNLPDELYDFRRKIIGAVWPGTLPELESALKTLSITMHLAAQKFREHHREHSDGRLYADKFYKSEEWDDHFDEKAESYRAWLSECFDAMVLAVKAANWFADVVRRDLNPMFFATEGKFLAMVGPLADFSYRTELYEFEDHEKRRLPDSVTPRGN